MPDTPQAGETGGTQPLENQGNGQGTPAPAAPAQAPATPPTVKTEDGEVERLRKEKEQAEMRANQLQNQLSAKEKAEADAKAKELEEQEQFKSLYEQEKAKREAIEAERQEQEQKAELDKARQEVLSAYNDEVKALAEEVGLDLTSADDAAIDAFKEKLDKINTRVVSTGKVSGNNQPNTNQLPELSKDELREGLQDENKFHDIVVARFPGIAAMTNQKKS